MVFDSSHYRRIGFKQSKTQEPLIALRGNIYDKNGVPLTKNIIHYSVGAHVEKIKNKEEIAISLSKITGRDSDFYSKKLKNKRSGYQVLELKVGRKVGEKIEKEIPELKTRKQSRRFYPHANIASQIIGFTKHNDSGLVGIERYYEKFLAGKDGWIVKQKNVAGRKGSFHKTSFPIKEPIKGSNMYN
jgi:stage V sporulation protein D (sporulation-specific penicillin-binding protein)